MHDLPYQMSKDVGPEVPAIMARICSESITNVLGSYDRQKFILGVQILAGANQQALAVATAAGISLNSIYYCMVHEIFVACTLHIQNLCCMHIANKHALYSHFHSCWLVRI